MLYSTAEPNIETPIKQKINKIIKNLNHNKHPKRIVAELLKNGEESIKSEIWKIIKVIWENEVIPGEWNTEIFCKKMEYGCY